MCESEYSPGTWIIPLSRPVGYHSRDLILRKRQQNGRKVGEHNKTQLNTGRASNPVTYSAFLNYAHLVIQINCNYSAILATKNPTDTHHLNCLEYSIRWLERACRVNLTFGLFRVEAALVLSAGMRHVAKDVPPEAGLLLTGAQLHTMNHLQALACSQATDEKGMKTKRTLRGVWPARTGHLLSCSSLTQGSSPQAKPDFSISSTPSLSLPFTSCPLSWTFLSNPTFCLRNLDPFGFF